jgi:WD40 repeat protein
MLWDLTTGQAVAALARHTGLISHVAFSPDGRRLAAFFANNEGFLAPGTEVSADVKIWDATPLPEAPGTK